MVSLSAFFGILISHPILAIIMIIVIASAVVDGANASPNTVAAAVGARTLKPSTALAISAGCTIIGLLIISLFSNSVAGTILNMVDFGADNSLALIGLCAGTVAVIVWCTASWFFGIPTSNSHALMSGITGAGVAITGFGGVNGHAWGLILLGLVVSSILGFSSGWILARLTRILTKNAHRAKATQSFRRGHIVLTILVSMLHGSQDGQKFAAVALMGIIIASGGDLADVGSIAMPIWLILLIGIAMACGTIFGGKRIIKTVGTGIAKLEAHQGCVASLACALCIGFATFTGIPLSDVHTCNTSIMGVGAEHRFKAVKWSVATTMVLTWVITFPACGILGFCAAKIFLLF